jgi:uncharacterized protein
MTINPLQKSDRINELDIFRGFAILGIFMVNILVMNVSFAYRGEWEAEQTGWLQRASFFVLETIFYSKFFTIFSFLFGVGVALQIQGSKQKGNFSNSFFLRRFGSLFLLGILHILFVWAGDILHLYGMLGLLLLLFFRGSAKVLLLSASVVFLFPFYTILFEQIVEWLSFDYSTPLASLSREEIFELKHHGSYLSGIILRLKEYAFATALIYSGITPVALTMMLLGGYAVKKGWLENIYVQLIKIKPYLFAALVILLVYRFILLYWILPSFETPFGSALSITLLTFFQLSDVVISFSFLWLIGYLWNIGFARQLLSPLQYVGRMALSNYIFQSIIGYLIMRTFNGYEYFSPFGCILLVLAIYSVQIVLSKLWLNNFRFGPLEWVWRCISYMKLLPIKKSVEKTI